MVLFFELKWPFLPHAKHFLPLFCWEIDGEEEWGEDESDETGS